MIHEAYAYVVREDEGQKQLLVFEQNGCAARVPAGVVLHDEDWADVVLRNLAEQTGLQHASIQRFLTSDYEEKDGQRINRHFYLLKVADVQQEWTYTPKDAPDVTLHCYWISAQQLDNVQKPMADYAYLAFQ